ncbi:TIGR00730 family Rossman fold protein [Alphaproteobacteria bacterium]|nr:TIGR00730 family Rossman fold protein [Alphaproteobacteria bacterium]
MKIKSLTIYCSSSEKLHNDYYVLAENIGLFLASKSVKIIFGGGKTGLMGKVSKSAFLSGAEVIGIIPGFLSTKEKINNQTTKTIIVNDMTERKRKLYEYADTFLILPGGSGTFEEATEIISWKFLGLHDKNIIIFNFRGYWDNFIKLYDEAKEKKFGNKNLQSICHNVTTLDQFINLFKDA